MKKTKRSTAKTKSRRARPLHKKIFLHPITVFLFLCFGVAMVGVSVKSFAESLTVVAKVSAPLPGSPAKILIISPVGSPTLQRTVEQANSPQTALFTNKQQVTLTGECPAASHIEFYRNNIFVGAAACIGDPTFSIQIDLVPGLNIITAHVFNITEDEGPLSLPIYLDYQLTPSQIAESSNNQSVSNGSNTPSTPSVFTLTSDFQYLGFLVGHSASWNIIFSGGTAPYFVSVNWGDGKSNSFTQQTDGIANIRHTYQKASDSTGYPIYVQAKDSKGKTATLSLITIISSPNSYQASEIKQANAALNPSNFEKLKKWVIVAWPAYIVLLLMLVSFWLGEREEYYKIAKRFISRNKRRR